MFKVKKRQRGRRYKDAEQKEAEEKEKEKEKEAEKGKNDSKKNKKKLEDEPVKSADTGDSSKSHPQQMQQQPALDEQIDPTKTDYEEMELPTFFSIGKWARNCLRSGYVNGNWEFKCQSQGNDECAFYSFWTGKYDMKTIRGGVGAEQQYDTFVLTQGIHTDGLFSAFGYLDEDDGGMVKAVIRAALGTLHKPRFNLRLNAGYHAPPFRVDMIVPIFREPKMKGYILWHSDDNLFLAYRSVLDLHNMVFDMHALCFGLNNGDSEVSVKIENFKVRGSIFQRLSESFAYALEGNLFNTEESRYTIGGQLQLDDDTMLKAKLSHDGLLEAVYQLQLNENVSTVFSCGFKPTAPFDGEYKIGVSLNFTE